MIDWRRFVVVVVANGIVMGLVGGAAVALLGWWALLTLPAFFVSGMAVGRLTASWVIR
jgi:hypothetical protein